MASSDVTAARFSTGLDMTELGARVRATRLLRGLSLVAEIKAELAKALAGPAGLPDLVGMDAAAVTAEPWPRY